MLDNGVTPLVLQLLQTALCPPMRQAEKPTRSKSSSPEKSLRKEKSRSEEPDEGSDNCGSDESLCVALVQQLSSVLTSNTIMARLVQMDNIILDNIDEYFFRFIGKFLSCWSVT